MPLFLTLSARNQDHCLPLHHEAAVVQVPLAVAERLNVAASGYEHLDDTGVPVRHAKRWSRGWLAWSKSAAFRAWAGTVASAC